MSFTEREPNAAVVRAVDIVGTQSALAALCGYSQQAISSAATGLTRPSPDLALAIHFATGGEVGAHEVAPHIWHDARAVPNELPPHLVERRRQRDESRTKPACASKS